MKNRGLPQEGLKLLACVTMLMDHIGAVLVAGLIRAGTSEWESGLLLNIYDTLRVVGRLAFPIFCFLLTEGSVHTRNPGRYGIRLLGAALVSEIPFDLALYGGFSWRHQNVMLTLLLGFLALEVMKRYPNLLQMILAAVPFAVLAEFFRADYGAEGVMLITLFALTREIAHKRMIQFLGMWFIFSPMHGMMLNWLGGISVTIQELAVLALIPIHFYSGQKVSRSKALQWAFYLFYPAHLVVLYLLK